MFSHCLLFDIARSSQINAHIGVDPNTQCIARRFVGCITEPFQEEQVLLSSLLPAYHTHTRDPYSQAISYDDGYRHYNDVVIHLTYFMHYCITHHYDNTRPHLPLTCGEGTFRHPISGVVC